MTAPLHWVGFEKPCRECAQDPDGRHHYHCGRCGEGPTSMLGHWRKNGDVDWFTCEVCNAVLDVLAGYTCERHQ